MRAWKIELTHGSKTWSRIQRAEKISIGNRLGNELRLPSPCPAHLLTIEKDDDEMICTLGDNVKLNVKKEHDSFVIEHNQKTIRISDVSADEKLIPLTIRL